MYLQLLLVKGLREDLLTHVFHVDLAGLDIHGGPLVVHFCLFALLLRVGGVQRVES